MHNLTSHEPEVINVVHFDQGKNPTNPTDFIRRSFYDSSNTPHTEYEVLEGDSRAKSTVRTAAKYTQFRRPHRGRAYSTIEASFEHFAKDKQNPIKFRIHLLPSHLTYKRHIPAITNYMRENNIVAISTSISHHPAILGEYVDFLDELSKRSDTAVFTSAGNDGVSYNLKKGIRGSDVFHVGSTGRDFTNTWSNANFTHTPQGPKPDERKARNDVALFEGTSFASPLLSGAIVGAISKGLDQQKVHTTNEFLRLAIKQVAHRYREHYNENNFKLFKTLSHEQVFDKIDQITQQVLPQQSIIDYDTAPLGGQYGTSVSKHQALSY